MNTKTLIAHYVGSLAQEMAGDPFEVELIEGPGEGTRLAGCVGWTGSAWRVMVDKSCSDWQFTKNLWHEVAHILGGDVGKRDPATDWDIDRALIAGAAGDQHKARLARYLGADADKEAKRTAHGDRMARQFLPGLNDFLSEVAGGASVESALAWRFRARHKATMTRAEQARKFAEINAKHKVTRFEMRPHLCTPIVEFAHSELTTAKAATDPEIWEFMQKVKHLGSEAMAFVAKVLQRRKKYVEWLSDLIDAGLIPAAGAAYG